MRRPAQHPGPAEPEGRLGADQPGDAGDHRGGTLLRPETTSAWWTLFQDQYAEGDARCFPDAATQSFYFTEIGFPVATGPAADDNNTTADVVVMNKHGVAAYQFDT